MTAAIFGVIGVFVGGVLGGVVAWLIELSRQRHAARGSARLLGHELKDNRRVLEEAIRFARPPTEPEAAADKLGELSQTQWARHRDRLSRGLRKEDFDVISDAFINLHKIDSAAGSFRAFAAAKVELENGNGSGERRGPDLRAALARLRKAKVGLELLPALADVGLAVGEKWQDWKDSLKEALAWGSLASAHQETVAALKIVESVGQDSALRRLVLGRGHSNGEGERTSDADVAADGSTSTEALSGGQTVAESPVVPSSASPGP